MTDERFELPGVGVIPAAHRRRPKVVFVLAAVVAAAALWAGICCIAPQSFRATKYPRGGRAMNHRLAIVYSVKYQISIGGLEKLHPFDMRKYAKIYLKLNTEGLIRPEDVFVPEPASEKQILMVHSRRFLESLKHPSTVARYLEAPPVALVPKGLLDAGMLEPFRYATGGTILTARLALKHGIAVNLAGGYHHAKPHAGEGFCIYADMPIAIRALQGEGLIRRALIVDLDVHQGNGTAVIFKGDDSVFTFSMHQGDIYPIPKEKSDLDVDLPAGTDDAAFNGILKTNLPRVIDRSRPDIVFLQAGCDTLGEDPLASLAMTAGGIVARDAMVIDECVRRGVPVVVVLGGGYSKLAWAAQYKSIERTIRKYGLATGQPPYPPRKPTGKERLYTK